MRGISVDGVCFCVSGRSWPSGSEGRWRSQRRACKLKSWSCSSLYNSTKLNLKTSATSTLFMTHNFSIAFLRVTLDLRDPLDLRVRRAREDPLVSLVLLDLLATVELEWVPDSHFWVDGDAPHQHRSRGCVTRVACSCVRVSYRALLAAVVCLVLREELAQLWVFSEKISFQQRATRNAHQQNIQWWGEASS